MAIRVEGASKHTSAASAFRKLSRLVAAAAGDRKARVPAAADPDGRRRLRTHWRRWQAALCRAQIDPKRASDSKEQRAAMRLYFRGTRSGQRGVPIFRVVHFPEID